MMHQENKLSTNSIFGTTSEESIKVKEAYEKPTLDIVKFMFESDITFGSFETGKGEDNYFDDSAWWED